MLGLNMNLQTELTTPNPEEGAQEILSLSEIRTRVAEMSSSLQEPGVDRGRVLKEIDSLVVMAAGLDQLCDKVANKRLFNTRLEDEIYRASRTGSSLVIVVLDLDNFKLVNDTLGHEAGNRILQGVATKLKEKVKKTDTVARLGGDEFGLLLPETLMVYGLIVAVRVLREIPNLTLPSLPGKPPLSPLTASIGMAQLVPGENAETFFDRADKDGLLAAKKDGKDLIALVTSGGQNFSISGLQSQVLRDPQINPDHKTDLIQHIMEKTLLIPK